MDVHIHTHKQKLPFSSLSLRSVQSKHKCWDMPSSFLFFKAAWMHQGEGGREGRRGSEKQGVRAEEEREGKKDLSLAMETLIKLL